MASPSNNISSSKKVNQSFDEIFGVGWDHLLPFELLKRITEGFTSELRRDDSDIVFKGVYESGKEVSVKVPRGTTAHNRCLLQNELDILTHVGSHQNIVNLHGWSKDSPDGTMALCYNNIHKQSLEKLLDDSLDWTTWYAIISGICDGLKYLHEKDRIHLNLKLANILVDEENCPVLANFGMADLCKDNDEMQDDEDILEIGEYTPPEYFIGRNVSKKYDIFCLGVIILKILAGKNTNIRIISSHTDILDRKVEARWIDGMMQRPMCTKQVEVCKEIALNCLNKSASGRCTINQIVDKLNEIN